MGWNNQETQGFGNEIKKQKKRKNFLTLKKNLQGYVLEWAQIKEKPV